MWRKSRAARKAFSMDARIHVFVGGIETLAVDAVVNAANAALRPGTGVDGALRAAAGPELTRLTATLPPLEEGGAVITPGFNAPARFIIHTAAPVWFEAGDEGDKRDTLAACYRACIALAHEHSLASIAFPCLGTGNFGWPRDVACATAIVACLEALAEAPAIEQLIFCCFTDADAEIYRAVFG